MRDAGLEELGELNQELKKDLSKALPAQDEINSIKAEMQVDPDLSDWTTPQSLITSSHPEQKTETEKTSPGEEGSTTDVDNIPTLETDR
jgi:hypothetical protein